MIVGPRSTKLPLGVPAVLLEQLPRGPAFN